MEQVKHDNETGSFAPICSVVGAVMTAWGLASFCEARADEARKDEIIRGMNCRIDEIESRIESLTRNYESGKITNRRYKKRLKRYKAKQEELFDDLYGLDADIEKQKKEAVDLVVRGGATALEGYLLDSVAKLFEDE